MNSDETFLQLVGIRHLELNESLINYLRIYRLSSENFSYIFLDVIFKNISTFKRPDILCFWYTNYKNQLFAPMYCFKNVYTLKTSTHIKINFKITPTCFGPTGPSSGSTSFLSQSYHEYYDVFYLIWFNDYRHAAAEPHCNVLINDQW